MPSNLEDMKIGFGYNNRGKEALIASPAGVVEAVLGIEVVDHYTFNQTVIAQLHATDANQKVEELLSVLERAAIGGGLVSKELHDGLHLDFPTGPASKRIDFYMRTDGAKHRSMMEYGDFWNWRIMGMTAPTGKVVNPPKDHWMK